MNLNIIDHTVTGSCRVSAPFRKLGRLGLKVSVARRLSDDDLARVTFARPIAPLADRLVTVRKDPDPAEVDLRFAATLKATIVRVHLTHLVDGDAPDERAKYATPYDGLEAVLLTLSARAGRKDVSQTAVVVVYGTGEQLGRVLELQGTDVAIRIRSVQSNGPLFDAATQEVDEDDPFADLKFGQEALPYDGGVDEEELPPEPEQGVILRGSGVDPLAHLPADERESARANLEPEKPKRRRRTTDESVGTEVGDEVSDA